MKIQLGEKGEVGWDLLLEVVQEAHHSTPPHPPPSRLKRVQEWLCSGWWLTIVIVLMVVLACQGWLLLHFLYSHSTVYTPLAHFVYTNAQGQLQHVKFSWSNCGNDSDAVKVTKLQVGPDPLKIDRNLTLDLVASLSLNVDAPVTAAVKVKRRVGWFWVKVPCLHDVGSCYYHDVCQLSPFPAPDPCPDPFVKVGLPCRCPVKKGDYVVQNGVFSLPDILDYLPSWLVTGDYHVRASALKDGTRLGCYDIYVSVSS